MFDAFHLSGQWNGICMVGTASDADNNNVVVCFCICPIENKSNYEWMFSRMKRNPEVQKLLEDPGLVIISDRDKGLSPAVAAAMPQAEHRFCLQHMIRNAPAVGPVGNMLVWSAAKASDETTFTRFMNKLKEIKPASYAYLLHDNQNYKLWCSFKTDRALFGQLTSNWAESSANWVGKKTRSSTVINVVDSIVVRTMEQFALRREGFAKQNSTGLKYTAWSNTLFDREMAAASKYKVQPSDENVHYVTLSASGERREVDLSLGRCSCRFPSQYLIACRHVLATCIYRSQGDVLYRRDSKFLIEEILDSYRMSIQPPIPEELQHDEQIREPDRVNQKGAPRKKRRRSKGEFNKSSQVSHRENLK